MDYKILKEADKEFVFTASLEDYLTFFRKISLLLFDTSDVMNPTSKELRYDKDGVHLDIRQEGEEFKICVLGFENKELIKKLLREYFGK
ncbi:hypothetical protein GW932_00215 [archaeon]|nr:hypothetical protein [archaeon]